MAAEKPQNKKQKAANNKGKRLYPPASSRLHLKTFEDVRRLLSATINDLRQQKIDPVVARPIMYGCSVILQVFEGKLIEQDIKELQKIAQEQFGYGGQ